MVGFPSASRAAGLLVCGNLSEVDSREVSISNKESINEKIAYYGVEFELCQVSYPWALSYSKYNSADPA